MSGERPPRRVHAVVPTSWSITETWTFRHPTAQANVVVAAQPLAIETGLPEYLRTQAVSLRTNLPCFEQLLLTEVTTPQGPLPLRVYEWTPPAGVRVRQQQLAWVDQGTWAFDAPGGATVLGTGYLATATSPVTTADLLDAELHAILTALRLGEAHR